MTLPRKRGHGGERASLPPFVGRPGEREQRFDVGAALAGRQYDQLVDDFFARQLHARNQPPCRRVEPEHGAHYFLRNAPRPVAPLDVQQLVTDHRPLNVRVPLAKGLGQDDDGLARAKRDRLRQCGVTDLRPRAEHPLQLLVVLARGGPLACGAESTQHQQSCANPCEPAHDSSGEDEGYKGRPGNARSGGACRRRRILGDFDHGSGRDGTPFARLDRPSSLHQRQHQAQSQQKAPVRIADVRRADAHERLDERGQRDDAGDLKAVSSEVGEERRTHQSSVSSMSCSISRRCLSVSFVSRAR
jgi:hypothetical protein